MGQYADAVKKHKTKALAARALGLKINTFKSRLTEEQNQEYMATNPKLVDTMQPFRIGGTPADRRVVELEGEVVRMRSTIRGMHKSEIDAQAVRELLGNMASAEVKPPKWTVPAMSMRTPGVEVPVTIWADWHAGEVVKLAETRGVNEYNHEVMERRVRRLVATTIELCHKHGAGNYPGLVIELLGDFVSGALHPELVKSDEEEVIPTVLRVRNLLIWALDQMIDAFGFVYCPAVAGNHGRNTFKPEFKRYVFKNFDWMIYQLLIAHYAIAPNGDRIVIECNEHNEVIFPVCGIRTLAVHGDMLGVKGGDGIIGAIGPIMRGEMKTSKRSGDLGVSYDLLTMGHWHQSLYLPRIIVSNTLKGYDEYASKGLNAPPSTPSQPLWFVHPKWGRVSYREVLVEDPRRPAASADDWIRIERPKLGAYAQPIYTVPATMMAPKKAPRKVAKKRNRRKAK